MFSAHIHTCWLMSTLSGCVMRRVNAASILNACHHLAVGGMQAHCQLEMLAILPRGMILMKITED